MVTAIGVEFEHKKSKIEELSVNSVAMSAGSALVGRQLLLDVRTRLSQSKAPPSVAQVVSLTKDMYVQYHCCPR